MPRTGANLSLKSLDDIFSTQEQREAVVADEGTERVQQLRLSDLVPFKNHPFKVKDDEDMEKTVDSIRQFGVLSPVIVRPLDEGGYEIVSGHRRCHASELAGLETIPAIVVCGEADTEEMLEDIALAKRLRITATTLEGILTIENKAASNKPKKR